jgi:hypothetical protein
MFDNKNFHTEYLQIVVYNRNLNSISRTFFLRVEDSHPLKLIKSSITIKGILGQKETYSSSSTWLETFLALNCSSSA